VGKNNRGVRLVTGFFTPRTVLCRWGGGGGALG
jgi:hypothetical protein